jgi:ribosomal protein S8
LRDTQGFCKGFQVGKEKELLPPEEIALMGKFTKEDTVITRMHECKRVGLRRFLTRIAQEESVPWSLEEGRNDSELSL